MEKIQVKDLTVGMIIHGGCASIKILAFLPNFIQKNGKPRRRAMVDMYYYDKSTAHYGRTFKLETHLGKFETWKRLETNPAVLRALTKN